MRKDRVPLLPRTRGRSLRDKVVPEGRMMPAAGGRKKFLKELKWAPGIQLASLGVGGVWGALAGGGWVES